MKIEREARDLFRSRNLGVLSTISVEVEGYPFGSVTPYCVDGIGEAVVLISSLAEHTRNVRRNPRVSLTVLDASHRDPLASSRLTLVADAYAIEGPDDQTRAVYLSHFPQAAAYFDFHDFTLYRLEVRRVRFIGGFGKIHWIEPKGFRLANPLADAEAGILEHMNHDHAAALADYCRAFLGREPRRVVMSGIDAEGFDLLVDGHHARLALDSPVATPEEARAALVALVREARRRLS